MILDIDVNVYMSYCDINISGIYFKISKNLCITYNNVKIALSTVRIEESSVVYFYNNKTNIFDGLNFLVFGTLLFKEQDVDINTTNFNYNFVIFNVEEHGKIGFFNSSYVKIFIDKNKNIPSKIYKNTYTVSNINLIQKINEYIFFSNENILELKNEKTLETIKNFELNKIKKLLLYIISELQKEKGKLIL